MYQNQITYEPTFERLPILTSESLGCQKDILYKTKQLLDYSLSQYSRIMFFRFDLTFPQNYNPPHDNKLLSNFIHDYCKYFKRLNIFHNYLWVREQSREKHQHYHFIFMIESSQFMSCYDFLDKAEKTWGRILGISSARGLVDRCVRNRNGDAQRNGIRIDRCLNGYNPEYAQCFEWASYLAKVNTKQSISGVRNWGGSIISKQSPPEMCATELHIV